MSAPSGGIYAPSQLLSHISIALRERSGAKASIFAFASNISVGVNCERCELLRAGIHSARSPLGSLLRTTD